MSTAESEQSAPKKLRFITNQGAPHPKRRRVTAACQTCRRRKIACSGEHPTCQTCRHNRLACAGYSKQASNSSRDDFKPDNRKERSYEHNPGTVKEDQRPTERDSVRIPGIEDFRHASFPMSGNHVKSDTTIAEALNHNRSTRNTLLSRARNRMPYFRWLGPTAIMPGFKQMVVKVKRDDSGAPSSTEAARRSPRMHSPRVRHTATCETSSVLSSVPMPIESDLRTRLALPFYDSSSMPPSELITHLCESFFVHLGCNFPFLQKDRFLKDLEDKRVDAILVDAVCAMAARFSKHPLLAEQARENTTSTRSEAGQAFAQRAKAALIDTYAVPSVAAVQAALLLAYNEFGESRDTGLWMYLGISIRMAQDLGLQKLEGLRFVGRSGPTPKQLKRPSMQDHTREGRAQNFSEAASLPGANTIDAEEIKAIERERLDTFWAVFFLDRVVSSGTGRRSTLRDNDIEVGFPALDAITLNDGWPSPFPALIRVIHLYGRVTDLLNSVKEPADITSETSERLAIMEKQVTDLYQGLSPQLHFEAMNFQRYVKAGEGTNFVLLHFWFHTLIILMHQPTLLKTFEGKMLQLFPNSQQLSMSSAKTIADILSYSQLIDAKAILGNPFTTQPMYIAACAFLKEVAERTATSADQSRAQSREGSQVPLSTERSSTSNGMETSSLKDESTISIPVPDKVVAGVLWDRSVAKHALLAKAASQHYQLCYTALESMETYWAGTKYILTVLDQKFKGVGDPLLYTVEEGESSLEQPRPEPSFTSPGWRRKESWSPSSQRDPSLKNGLQARQPPAAIGWSLTGTLNSPNSNLASHFLSTDYDQVSGATMNSASYPTNTQHVSDADPENPSQPSRNISSIHDQIGSNRNMPVLQRPLPVFGTPGTADPHPARNPQTLRTQHSFMPSGHAALSYLDYYHFPESQMTELLSGNVAPFGDMLIENQDVDVNLLGLDMLPWLDSQPANMSMPIMESDLGHSMGVTNDSHRHDAPLPPPPFRESHSG